MDEDLTAILNELDHDQEPVEPLFPGTTIYVPDLLSKFKPAAGVKSRIERLYETVSTLAKNLHLDFWTSCRCRRASTRRAVSSYGRRR